ncbi:hypothetical protein IWX90DRAFT_35314 [Phyllosticta citrichinensis]|uniref:Uncharacterized protein n=1 Tax=Phyllosticta citrichinensis TaxID=1130410 RepID=A0ABR1Y8H2_9PEZI
MPPVTLVAEALSTSFKCAEFAHPPPHDAFFMDADADVPLPSIERNGYDDIAFRPSSASLLLSRHGNSSTTTSSRASSPSRRHNLMVAADDSRTSTPASDFSSSLLSKYGGVNGSAAFHATATASPRSSLTPLNDAHGFKTTVAGGKKYPGLLHPHPHRQSKSNLESPATRLESDYEQQNHHQSGSESNMMAHADDTQSTTPTSRRQHHHRKHRTHKKPSSTHHSSDARDTRPLILLHATVLPVTPPAPLSTMAAANIPWHVRQNWRLLEQKLSDPVLMSRGLLLPHPRDEYDLLEERLLEALELKTPRVWRCGHFYGSEEADDAGKKRADSAIGTDEERPEGLQERAADSSPDSNALDSSGSDNGDDSDDAANAPVCSVCCEPLHVPPSLDRGAPNRWDIRIFAANGLMRSSAWSAAWSEMERVDVAITPLLTSAQRLALAAQVEREARQTEQLEMARVEEAQREAADRAKNEELGRERQRVREMERERAAALEVAERQEADKLRYMAAAAVAAAAERRVIEESARDTERLRAREVKELQLAKKRQEMERNKALLAEKQQMPLSRLLCNCAVVFATDRRNVAALLLGVIVAAFWLCFGGSTAASSSGMAQHCNANVDASYDVTPISSVDGNPANNSVLLPFDAVSASTAAVTSTVTLFLSSSTASPPTASNVESIIASQAFKSSNPPATAAVETLEPAMANDESATNIAFDAADGGSERQLEHETSVDEDKNGDTDATGPQCPAPATAGEDALFGAVSLPLCSLDADGGKDEDIMSRREGQGRAKELDDDVVDDEAVPVVAVA